MSFELPELPYAMNALEPYISQETLEYHYGRHHRTYVNNLNNLTEGTVLADASLEDIIKMAGGGIFNNAAQIWNHTFYWHSLSPNGGGEPGDNLKQALTQAFGSVEQFKERFNSVAKTTFGSCWAWLVKNQDGELEVVGTSNAGNPLTQGKTPLLTCDMWEHAYYIDYRNAKPQYLDAFWQIVNWKFVEQNLEK